MQYLWSTAEGGVIPDARVRDECEMQEVGSGNGTCKVSQCS